MEQVEDSAEEEAEDCAGQEDEDRPPGDELGVVRFWVQFHGAEDVGVEVFFECLGMGFEGVKEGVVELVFYGCDYLGGDDVLVELFILVDFVEFGLEFFFDGVGDALNIVVEKSTELI